MNTWQTVYEQLQEILNKCIELWWNYCYLNEYLECNKEWLLNEDLIPLISYHELFSKDSGLMEFVEWQRWKWDDNYYDMANMTAEEKCKYFVNSAIIPTK